MPELPEAARDVIATLGPKRLGRRKYDQARWWYAWVRDLGFAGFAYYLLHVGFGYLERLDRARADQAAAMVTAIENQTKTIVGLGMRIEEANNSCADLYEILSVRRNAPRRQVIERPVPFGSDR